MLQNQPFQSHSHGGLTIEGYSRAAVQTYWRIAEWKLGFDLGGQPWDFMGTPTWFVSHTHLDHIAALPVYVARRRMMKMEPPTIYVPQGTAEGIRRLLQQFSRLDRGRMPCDLIEVSAGQEITLSRELAVSCHATRHTVPSLGYIVWERRRKLKPEYQGLTGEQIRDIRLGGVEVSEERRAPRLAYVGDSTARGLDDNPDMYRAEILITEMTFLSPQHRAELLRKMGHMHLNDFVKRQERFENQLIIAAHFSTRYHPRQIQKLASAAFPDALQGRLKLWI